MTADTGDALRADARRNRARVLDVALETFATEGMSVALGEIARRAGVGAGTVYRHFPSKERLFEEVLAHRAHELVRLGRALAEDGEDPGTRFFAFFDEVVAQATVNRALCDGFRALSGRETKLPDELFAEYLSVLDGLLTAAQAAGAVREDVDTMDVHVLIWGAAQVQSARRDPARGHRLARVVAEGLRADVTKALPITEHRHETPGPDGDETPSCAHCGRPIEASPTGRPAKFCGPACRQKAYRAKHRRPPSS